MKRNLSGLLAFLFALLPATVFSAGFEIPDNGTRSLGRGGAFVVGAQDLTALHYNPARLAQLGGTRLLYNHNYGSDYWWVT